MVGAPEREIVTSQASAKKNEDVQTLDDLELIDRYPSDWESQYIQLAREHQLLTEKYDKLLETTQLLRDQVNTADRVLIKEIEELINLLDALRPILEKSDMESSVKHLLMERINEALHLDPQSSEV